MLFINHLSKVCTIKVLDETWTANFPKHYWLIQWTRLIPAVLKHVPSLASPPRLCCCDASLHDVVVVCNSFRLHGGNSPFLHLLYRHGDGQRLKVFIRRMTSGALVNTVVKINHYYQFSGALRLSKPWSFPKPHPVLFEQQKDWLRVTATLYVVVEGFLEPVVCVAEDNWQCLQSRILKVLQHAFMRKSGDFLWVVLSALGFVLKMLWASQ